MCRAPKAHGTCVAPVQKQLRWSSRYDTADRICCFNRHYAEHSGYWEETTFLQEVRLFVPISLSFCDHQKNSQETGDRPITFADSVTGKPLFIFDPQGNRSFEEFKRESLAHGWPSFRDEDVVWENVRVLPNGEAISVDGTHLGHDLPDGLGHRYCINLVSVAGQPEGTSGEL